MSSKIFGYLVQVLRRQKVEGGMWMFSHILLMLLCADVHLYDIGPKPLVICVDFADIVSSDENALRNRKRTFMVARAWSDWLIFTLLITVLAIISWFWYRRPRPRLAEVESASWPIVHQRSGGPRARVVAAGKISQDRYDWLQQGGLSFW